ncbi:hypothetical protein BH20ACT15_BH20ACT15_02460 [soil metagenome]
MERKARERGADGYLEEGTPMSDLRTVVREAMTRRQAEHAEPSTSRQAGGS